MRSYYEKNREKTREYQREYYRENHQTMRANARRAKLRNDYGLTVEEFARMVLRQGGRCAICRDEFAKGRTCVDHDHKTGRVRALLCPTCNTGIGQLRDDPEIVRRAYEYLAR